MPGPRILVVDDEPDILTALRALFEGALGGQVVVTTMPHMALMALGTKPGFDLVVTDYRMPGMDGVAFLERAKEMHPEVPRILMTAFMDPAVRRDALTRGGASLCLAKPLDPEPLLTAIDGILRRAAKGPKAGPRKPSQRHPARIPTFPAQPAAEEAEQDLPIAVCSSCRGQVIIDPSQFAQDRSGWMSRPCFLTPGCIGRLEP